jgi:hypothetical protein
MLIFRNAFVYRDLWISRWLRLEIQRFRTVRIPVAAPITARGWGVVEQARSETQGCWRFLRRNEVWRKTQRFCAGAIARTPHDASHRRRRQVSWGEQFTGSSIGPRKPLE